MLYRTGVYTTIYILHATTYSEWIKKSGKGGTLVPLSKFKTFDRVDHQYPLAVL